MIHNSKETACELPHTFSCCGTGVRFCIKVPAEQIKIHRVEWRKAINPDSAKIRGANKWWRRSQTTTVSTQCLSIYLSCLAKNANEELAMVCFPSAVSFDCSFMNSAIFLSKETRWQPSFQESHFRFLRMGMSTLLLKGTGVLISSFTANKFSFELYISAEVVQCFMQCKIEAVNRESR